MVNLAKEWKKVDIQMKKNMRIKKTTDKSINSSLPSRLDELPSECK